ncbi:MAG TPA: CBS domain-containing protein [Candidatus Binatia bacterium]
MLVSKRMKTNPVTVGPEDFLSTAHKEMQAGGFRRVPVIEDGRLVGIVTDSDLRQHIGYLEKTKVNAGMTRDPMTVRPESTLEEASKLLLKHKFGGLPVVDGDTLVGIITTSDILQAFLEVMGASEEGTVRIDLLLGGNGSDLTAASQAIADEGGEIFGVGTYRERWEESPVYYLRTRAADPNRVVERLKEQGFTVLGVQS